MEPENLALFELRPRLTEVISAVAEGRTFVVTRYGKPVAVIGPPQAKQQATPEVPASEPDEFGSPTPDPERARLLKKYGPNSNELWKYDKEHKA